MVDQGLRDVVGASRELTRLQVGQRTQLGGHPGLLISQAEIEAALRRRLTELGGEVEWGHLLTAVDQDTDGVLLRFRDAAPVRTGWLIGTNTRNTMMISDASVRTRMKML